VSDDLSSKTVCVVDRGLFCDVATVLAPSFGRTLLNIETLTNSPTSSQLRVGEGLDGVEKIESIWDHVDEIDLFVFPDLSQGPLQQYLSDHGSRVWGSRLGDVLELDRDYAKRLCEDVGLAIGPYEVVTGIEALRKTLQAHDDRYVKISRSRGDFETFHSPSYAIAEPWLDEIARKLGVLKDSKEFIVEEPISDCVELAYDGYSVDGQFPSHAMHGVEIKDRGYIGKFEAYADMPAAVHDINDALAPVLRDYQYRNIFAVECRVQGDVPYVTDFCTRFCNPPSQLATLMYTNIAEILWHGAAGELVDPLPKGAWGAQVQLLSGLSKEQWQIVDFPAKLREHVRLSYPVQLDGRYAITPEGVAMTVVGAIVATGDTMDDAIEHVKEIADQVKGYSLEIGVECFDEAQAEFDKLTALPTGAPV
jgi:hypothetical protein